MSLTYTEAFAKYGAKLNNQMWSVSAFDVSGSLVVSLWQDLIEPVDDTYVYRDNLTLWKGNHHGRNEFRRHLNEVKDSGASIKLVVAHPVTAEGAALVGNVSDERKIKKTFSIREDLIGTLEEFDNDSLCIVFRRVV